MKKVLKQVAGIDVAQKELVVCLGRIYDDLSTELYAYKAFANTSAGFRSFLEWSDRKSSGLPMHFVMEATGVYHEALAYYLDGKDRLLSIVLPNKISNYFRSLEVKTVTDKTASEAIAQFGLERKLDGWQAPDPVYRRLKQLTRERDQVIQTRTVAKNQLHAEQAGAYQNTGSVSRTKKLILFLNNQEKEIKKEINVMLQENTAIKEEVLLQCSITGIGTLTAVTVLAETNGFDLIRNKKQLTSYAGLDVREKQSGTSIKGKPRISKKGNRYLRKAMHLPALAAIRHDDRYKSVFTRLVSKHGIKMKGAVAVQRKLLEMMFTIYKTKNKYDKNYLTEQPMKMLADII
jgi:transposase